MAFCFWTLSSVKSSAMTSLLFALYTTHNENKIEKMCPLVKVMATHDFAWKLKLFSGGSLHTSSCPKNVAAAWLNAVAYLADLLATFITVIKLRRAYYFWCDHSWSYSACTQQLVNVLLHYEHKHSIPTFWSDLTSDRTPVFILNHYMRL